LAATSPVAATAVGKTQAGGAAGALTAVGGTAAAAADAQRQSALLGADANGNTASATAADLAGKNLPGQALLLDATPTHAADDLQTSASPASIGVGALTLSAPVPGGMHVVQLAAPVGTPEFGHELGRQITWMGTHDIQQARIRLHPEELGQVDLKISVSHGRVDVVFSAQHPGAVQALQQSLPQLGQMLNQQGLSLGHSEVGQHGRDDSSTPRRGAAGAGADGVEEIHTISATTPVHALNLLVAFA
jgi:flagellar hook-length control protein FliK